MFASLLFRLFFAQMETNASFLEKAILPGVSWQNYPNNHFIDDQIYPHITGGRPFIFQGNMNQHLNKFDQTQMYTFAKR
jgi:hypothetical protein